MIYIVYFNWLIIIAAAIHAMVETGKLVFNKFKNHSPKTEEETTARKTRQGFFWCPGFGKEPKIKDCTNMAIAELTIAFSFAWRIFANPVAVDGEGNLIHWFLTWWLIGVLLGLDGASRLFHLVARFILIPLAGATLYGSTLYNNEGLIVIGIPALIISLALVVGSWKRKKLAVVFLLCIIPLLPFLVDGLNHIIFIHKLTHLDREDVSAVHFVNDSAPIKTVSVTEPEVLGPLVKALRHTTPYTPEPRERILSPYYRTTIELKSGNPLVFRLGRGNLCDLHTSWIEFGRGGPEAIYQNSHFYKTLDRYKLLKWLSDEELIKNPIYKNWTPPPPWEENIFYWLVGGLIIMVSMGFFYVHLRRIIRDLKSGEFFQ